jgi:hypothetical protein
MHKDAAAVRLTLKGRIFALVEDWRRSQPKIPSRNEAIRLLLRQALDPELDAGACEATAIHRVAPTPAQ